MPISKYKEFEDEDIPLDEWLSTLSDSERGAIGAPDSITVDDVAGPGSPEPEPAEAHPSRSLESLMAGAVPSGPEPAALAALAEGRQPPPLEPPPMAAPTAAPLPKFDLSALGEAALTPGGAAQGPMAERGGLLGGSGVEALPPATTAAAVAQQAVQTPSPVPGDKPPLPAPGANAIAAQAPVESPPPEGADMVLPSISVPSRPQAAPPRPQQGQAPFRPTSPGDVMALREMDNARFDREQPQPSRGGGGFDWSLLGASIANAAAGRDMRPYIEARARNEQAHAARMDKREQQQRAARKRDAVEAAERQQMADAKDQQARLDDPGSPESKRLHAALAQSLGGDAAAYSHISAGDYKRYGLGGMIKGADARRFKAAEAQKAQAAKAAADEARRVQKLQDDIAADERRGNTAEAKERRARLLAGQRQAAAQITADTATTRDEKRFSREDEKRLEDRTRQYSEKLVFTGIPKARTKIDDLRSAIGEAREENDGEIFSTKDNLVRRGPQGLWGSMSLSAQKVMGKLQALRNHEIKDIAGAAVSDSEMVRILAAQSGNMFDSEAAMLEWFDSVENALQSDEKTLMVGYGPDVLDQVDRNRAGIEARGKPESAARKAARKKKAAAAADPNSKDWD